LAPEGGSLGISPNIKPFSAASKVVPFQNNNFQECPFREIACASPKSNLQASGASDTLTITAVCRYTVVRDQLKKAHSRFSLSTVHFPLPTGDYL
jgi:hypothetical protein